MVQPRDPGPEHHYPPDMSVDPLDRLAAEAGVDEAVRRLGHQAWLRRRAEESASLSGLLADLAERQDPVELLLVGGGRRHGRIETVGSDLVGLRLDDRRLALVARRSLAAIRPDRGVPDLVGDRTVPSDGPNLRDVLDRLVADQPRVTITLVGTLIPVEGVLERLGRDVLLVREADGSATHLPFGAVVEVLVASD